MSDVASAATATAQALLAEDLVRRWAAMERFVVAGRSDGAAARMGLDPEEVEVVRRWASLFAGEIEAIRRARAFSVHLPASMLPLHDLVEANDLADRIGGLLAEKLPRFRAVWDEVHALVAGARAEAEQPVAPPAPPPAASAQGPP